MDDRKENFEENFYAFNKGQKTTSNFEKHLKQKRCAIRHLNIPNFIFFLKLG